MISEFKLEIFFRVTLMHPKMHMNSIIFMHPLSSHIQKNNKQQKELKHFK